MEFLQTCIDGLLFGSAYSLLALSFSLLFGVMKRINLAFGSTLLLSAVFSLWIDSLFSIGIFGIFLVMLASSALINIYVEKLCFYPHSGRYGATVSMISSFAIWMQLDEMSSFLLPDRTASFPSFLPDSFFLKDLFIRIDQLFLFLISVFMSWSQGIMMVLEGPKSMKSGTSTRSDEEILTGIPEFQTYLPNFWRGTPPPKG